MALRCTLKNVLRFVSRVVVDYHDMVEREHALLNRIENVTTEAERERLDEISARQKFMSTMLPIRTVGVQVIIK